MKQIASERGLTRAGKRTAVDVHFAAIAHAAASVEEVSINGFGTLKVRDLAAREGRDPTTDETISPRPGSSHSPPAKALKEKLNR